MQMNELDPTLNLSHTDLIDDLHFFIHNDPQFYRQIFYPVLSKLKNHLKNGKNCSYKGFKPIIDHAIAQYCRQYRIPGNPISVFTHTDRDELARKIFGHEKENIQTGKYDGEDNEW